jgi:hypothetical protein
MPNFKRIHQHLQLVEWERWRSTDAAVEWRLNHSTPVYLHTGDRIHNRLTVLTARSVVSAVPWFPRSCQPRRARHGPLFAHVCMIISKYNLNVSNINHCLVNFNPGSLLESVLSVFSWSVVAHLLINYIIRCFACLHMQKPSTCGAMHLSCCANIVEPYCLPPDF